MSEKAPAFKSKTGQLQYFAAYDASMCLWPVPYESMDVTTRYGQTHIIVCSPKDAFPVILLHGGYASSTMCFPNVADLSVKYRLLSPAASFISLNTFFRAVVAAVMRIRARPVLKAALYSWVAPGFKINPIFSEQFISGFLFWNWEMQRIGFSRVMPSAFNAEELSQMHVPVLMLIGDHDRLTPPGTIELARRMIPQLEGEIIPNAGHMLSIEQPALVDAQILKFLAGDNKDG
jgi:hypothetical protein